MPNVRVGVRPRKFELGYIAEHAKIMRVGSDHRLVISGETRTRSSA